MKTVTVEYVFMNKDTSELRVVPITLGPAPEFEDQVQHNIMELARYEEFLTQFELLGDL